MKYHNVNGRRYYEEEEKAWLIENYPKLGITETTRLFNEKFNHNKSIPTLKKYCGHRLGLKVSEERKAVRYDSFTKSIGDTFINCRGEEKIKTEEGWIPLSRYLVKPKSDEIVVHLNGDKTDNSIENLMSIKNGVHTIVRNAGLWSENADITRTAMMWGTLTQILNREGGLNEV